MMTNTIAHIMTQDGISCIVDGKNYMVANDHPNYNLLKDAVASGDEESFVKHYSDKHKLVSVLETPEMAEHNIEIKNGMVYYNGDLLHMTLTRRILDLYEDNFPTNSLMMFLCNLMENTSFNSREQLYTYLERHHIPITEDGYFLAYKFVNSNFTACHQNLDGTYHDNTPGKFVEMPRHLVDDNPKNHCSEGLHAGSFSFVQPESIGCGRKVVIVKVNPKDVVSVPDDYDCSKLRVCKYEVLSEYKTELIRDYYDVGGQEYSHPAWDSVSADEDDMCDECEEYVDECECGMYVDVDDLLEGQKISFTYYKKDGTVSDREIRVETVLPNVVIGYILNIQDYRTFTKTGMSEIVLL